MSLILKFNRKCKSLDLIGPIPVEAEQRVMQVMTYNPNLRCFQGAVNLQVLCLADDLHAIISPEVLDALENSIDPVRKGSGGEESPTERSKSPRVEETGVIGCIVKHSGLGLGRLLNLEGRVAVVGFFFPPSQKQLNPNYLRRSHIPIGTTCETKNGNCIIQERKPSQGHAPHIYRVEFENGLKDELPETVLSPIKLVKPRDPLEVLATLQHEGYPIFKTREGLAQTYNALLRRSVGVKSLLSSRIDLYPHQAYVAGTVILDSKQRYLLADEVGLGKTIEAGIVIHDLLARNPRANILIICPGSLVQQWFSEMYSKFSGVIFRLPELSGINAVMMGQAGQVILSFYAALIHRKALMDKQWDLIVIDEVHNLLRVQRLYELAMKLSLQDRGLLLLSALPAQHRDHEYYDLLAILEPKKYRQNDAQAREHFSMLFERQREIGGRIGVVTRRLTELHEDGAEPDRVIKQLATLIELPVLHDDQFLKTSIATLDPQSESFADTVHQILHHISDYYRINRRILRNRREKLIESEQLERVKRVKNTLFYNPDQYELDAVASLERFLQSLRQTKLPEKILLLLIKELFHAAVHPKTLLQTLKGSEQTLTRASEEKYEELQDLVSYSEWNNQMKYFWSSAMEVLNPELLLEAIRSVEAWERQGEVENLRLQRIFSMIAEKHRTQPKDKFIIFAGYPKLASILDEQLVKRFGQKSIARFYFGLNKDPILERNLKEQEVRRFRIDQQAWLLICDETGGEGRNFQFAAELIHYDLPWQVAKIEQRIGRLDRLGRKRPEVVSNVVIAKGSKEEAWLNCLSEGLGVFSQSISGLEFALRDVELDFAHNLLSDDDQVLWDMPTNIKARVIEERARDESQSQMDEASYERTKAEQFRRVQSNEKIDRDLEITFCQYFKLISDRDSIKFPRQVDDLEGVIEFYPEYVRQVQLNLFDNKKVRTGTFYREIAQNRPDLEFFSVGNDFFDSICHSLSADSTGRTYAVECIADQSAWRGFEFSYRVKPSSQFPDQTLVYQNILDYLFAERIEHCFVHENGKVKEPPGDLLRLRRSFDKQNKGKIWKNLTKGKADLLSDHYSNWDELLRTIEKTARKHVHQRYNQILTPKIEEQLKCIDEQIRKLQFAKPDGCEDQAQDLCRLKEVLTDWDLELDIAGFLSINGGILGF